MTAASTSASAVRDLGELDWDNRFTRDLPADPIDALDAPILPRQVEGAAFTRTRPTSVAEPALLLASDAVAADLGLDPSALADEPALSALAGNRVADGMDPFAMNYGGHQFGNWAGQLGDGRAIALGEVVDTSGHHQTLQLKGAGPTPYSRRADGRAVLRSSIREFLCSEAMHHLGVPTTRALSLVTTGDAVVRDMFYDGNAAPEPGAIVCRVAPSFVRLGTFELPTSRGDIDLLGSLVATTIRHSYPDLVGPDGTVGPSQIAAFVQTVVDRTARLMADWMRVGFVHGVMNTDNLSVLGVTIDYGPYGFLDDVDLDWTPNTTDFGQRRYRYGNQPRVAGWNLARFASALVPLMDGVEPLQEALDSYFSTYSSSWLSAMGAKLGVSVDAVTVPDDAEPTTSGNSPGTLTAEDPLFADLWTLLPRVETDFTRTFRALGHAELTPADGVDRLWAELETTVFYRPDTLTDELVGDWRNWLERFAARVVADARDPAERAAAADAVNPIYLLRNWLSQEAIDAATRGDEEPLRTLFDVVRDPFVERDGLEHYAGLRPDWARDAPGCSTLSCSS